MELKRGSERNRTLFYLSKAVQVKDYDENVLVTRSRFKQ